MSRHFRRAGEHRPASGIAEARGRSTRGSHHAKIDKISGKVAYAVLSFGGFLGIGEDYYPVPWPALKYDTNLGGYVTGMTQRQLDAAPKYNEAIGWNWTRENDKRVYDYNRDAPYWGA